MFQFFPVWSQSQYYWHWSYGFYLHRFSALSFWGDGCNWYQTGFYSNPFTFAGYRSNRFFLLTIKFLYTELEVTKKCRWSYFKLGWPVVGPPYQKYQKWREHELNISLDKVVSSCNNVGAYHLHGQTGRIKETLNEWSLWHEMPWRLIKCRLSIHRYTLNLQIRFYQGLQVIMRCSLPLHHFVLLLLEFNQSVMLITIDTQSSLDESDSI